MNLERNTLLLECSSFAIFALSCYELGIYVAYPQSPIIYLHQSCRLQSMSTIIHVPQVYTSTTCCPGTAAGVARAGGAPQGCTAPVRRSDHHTCAQPVKPISKSPLLIYWASKTYILLGRMLGALAVDEVLALGFGKTVGLNTS